MNSPDKKTLSERVIYTKCITPAVVKVNELMALYDQRKTQLTTTQTETRLLFDSLLSETSANQTRKD